MNDALHNYMGRPLRYNNIDGTGEMSVGVMLMGFALLGYLMSYLRGVLPEGWTGKVDPVGLLILFGGLGAMLGLILWGANAIKQHITWPRTGYVAYRRGGKLSWIAFASGAAIGVGFTCLELFARRHDAMSPPRTAYLAIMPAAYAYSICRYREHPWKWLVVLFMALGLLVITLTVPGDAAALVRPVMLFVGLTCLGSGGVTLYLYIQHTQPPAPETE